jgi:hypothetical protein
MTAGQRHIQSVNITADLPTQAQEGDLCWDKELGAMNVWKDGGWTGLNTGAADIFATLTYDTDKAVNVLNIPDVWTPILTLTTPSRPAGKYVVGLSFTYRFPDTNDFAEARFRVDGGAWNEFRSEPKDIADRIANFYEYPADYASGVHTIEFEMKKSTPTANQLDLLFLDLMFQRVG